MPITIVCTQIPAGQRVNKPTLDGFEPATPRLGIKYADGCVPLILFLAKKHNLYALEFHSL